MTYKTKSASDILLWLLADSAAELVTSGDDTIILIQDDDLEDSGSAGEDHDYDDNEDFNEISVPLTIVLSVIGGYIVFGTVLFGLWEGWNTLSKNTLGLLWEGWNMDTAAYYCFITISTIGFGDVVPSLSRPEDEPKLIAVCTYMLFGMATLSMCFTLVQDQMAAKFKMLGEKCGLLSRFKRSSKDEKDEEEGNGVETAARSVPVQPVPAAAGTELFERRRRKRVERLKFRWIRQQLSGKGRARRRQRTSSSSSLSGDDSRPRSDSVFDDDIAMTTTSETLVEPQPSTSHVITINGTAHPVRESLTPGEVEQLKQKAATTKSGAVRRRSTDGTTSTYDIQRRPLPNIAEERL